MDIIYKHFLEGLRQAIGSRVDSESRVGAELKFPLVKFDGSAVNFETICALWNYLEEHGWDPVHDAITNEVVGAKKPGEHNETVASCETGFCKTEFSLAHVANLFELEKLIRKLQEELRSFSEKHKVYFLGYGIQPVTPPSQRLLIKKERSSVFDRVFRSNRYIPEEDGHDIHLFTINAASHVHVDVPLDELILAVNVLNAFSAAQIALTANSNIWQNQIDPKYKCVNEKFWDWWMPDASRVGLPYRPFKDLEDYVCTVSSFQPIYVKRDGRPIVLTRYRAFEDYFHCERATGLNPEGQEVSLIPEKADIDLHNSFCWYNARISRYYTVENRVNDQQPPHDLACVAALTLGLVSVLPEAWEEVSSYGWKNLRAARETACRSALNGNSEHFDITVLAQKMLELAELGLRRRGLGEEKFLVPLKNRLRTRRSPADEAEQLFKNGGIEALLHARKL